MKFICLFLFYSIISTLVANAQIKILGEGRCEGTQITQADIDSLFIKAPDITWIEIAYIDTTLTFPDFKQLEILAIQSEVLQSMVFPDTLLTLGLIDFTTRNLTQLKEPVAPKLFQCSLHANLSNLPQFLCTSEELTLVDIKNYSVISWPDCLEERFINGDFDLSSCLIYDGIDGEVVSKIVSPDNAPDEWLEDADDMTDEEFKEFQKEMRKSERRIKLIRNAGRFVLAGVLFLIWKG